MDVPSIPFFAFSAVVALLLLISTTGTWRRSILALANVAFLVSFCASDPRRLVPFALFLLLGYAAMRFVERDRAKGALAGSVALVLIAYVILKRYTFVPAVLLPPDGYVTVGISYVIFRIVHLVVDSAQRALPERVSGLAYLSYTLNFTALVSGPIQLFGEYQRTEWAEPLPLDTSTIGAALYRIVLGCFKVVALSPALFALQTFALGMVSNDHQNWQRVTGVALAIGSFAPYVYANFSGYTDIVIGVARFLRLGLPENFSSPFSAEGFIEFWTRWHMSLSNWLKRYVYSTLLLALMRKNKNPKIEPWLAVVTYFITFFLVGVWHGRTTEFLFFGFLQGLGVSVNKAFQMTATARLGKKKYRELCARPAWKAISRAATFSWFSFSLIWFWATWTKIEMLTSTATPIGMLAGLVLLFLLAAAVYAVKPIMALFANFLAFVPGRGFGYNAYAVTAMCAVLFVIAVSAAVVTSTDGPHLVYKAF